MITALVVDDETIIAEDLASQLGERSGWDADYCTDPLQVLSAMAEKAFDVCFLDIEMPGQSGISLARKIRSSYPDVIIVFATAYAEHAATAYRLPATDYLVKPLNQNVLNEACVRVEQRLAQVNITTATGAAASANMIAVKSVGRTDYIKISDIVMAQAAGNYVRLYCRDKEYLHRIPFSDFSEQMQAEGFVRCHRSYMVNASCVISFVHSASDGDELILLGDVRAPISQSYRKSIDEALAKAAAKSP